MFRKKKASQNPEVLKAVAERDELMEDVKAAVQKVDKLKDDLLREYEEANGLPQKRGQ